MLIGLLLPTLGTDILHFLSDGPLSLISPTGMLLLRISEFGAELAQFPVVKGAESFTACISAVQLLSLPLYSSPSKLILSWKILD